MSAAGWAFATGTTIGFIRNPTDPLQNIGWGIVGAGITNPTSRGIILRVAGVVASDLYIIGSAASSAFAATRTGAAIISAGYVGAGIVAGAFIGAAVGTAISSVVFGEEGKADAIEFYTGQADNWYDYVPHYNAYKIVKHYVTN